MSAAREVVAAAAAIERAEADLGGGAVVLELRERHYKAAADAARFYARLRRSGTVRCKRGTGCAGLLAAARESADSLAWVREALADGGFHAKSPSAYLNVLAQRPLPQVSLGPRRPHSASEVWARLSGRIGTCSPMLRAEPGKFQSPIRPHPATHTENWAPTRHVAANS